MVFRDFDGKARQELVVSALSENDGEGLVTVLTATTQGVGGAGLFQVLRPQSLLIPTENLVRFGRSLVR